MAEKTKTRKLNFTKAAIHAIKPDPSKRIYIYDTKLQGLALGISPTGVKTFVLVKKVRRLPERFKLGRYPDITIDEARKKAAQLIGKIAMGENPADEKRLRLAEMTFGELFEDYYKKHALPFKKTAAEDRAKFDRYLSSTGKHSINLAARPLYSIDHSMLSSLMAKISLAAPVTANRVLALVSSVFGRAIEWGVWSQRNPVKGIRRQRENSRARFLHPTEIGPFISAVEASPEPTTRDFILISLFTGARRGNVLAMKWDDVDFQCCDWRIELTKNGTPQTVPLVEQAMSILLERKKLSTSKYVFPGDGKTEHLTTPYKAWKSILKRANMEGLRLHDLRRTMGSWQAGTNANTAIIGKSLNHRSTATTAVYTRLWDEPVRLAMAKAVDYMMLRGGLLPASQPSARLGEDTGMPGQAN